MNVVHVDINKIKVKKRVRKDLGDLKPLKDSLRTYGLMNPITINSKYELIAGERRLEAAKALGWPMIDAIMLQQEINSVTKLEMEIEENNQRKEFTDEELLDGYKRLNKLKNPSIFRRIMNFFVRLFEKIGEFFKNLFKKG
ncbi:MAG: ParB N-terminal domain-containing protein [Treponema sp.]|nr:ParB N-terminal domain-containing protein [Treponema sp.]MBQ5399610.1 ParB N-terminal domain-containing protein [Treponema sp.]